MEPDPIQKPLTPEERDAVEASKLKLMAYFGVVPIPKNDPGLSKSESMFLTVIESMPYHTRFPGQFHPAYRRRDHPWQGN